MTKYPLEGIRVINFGISIVAPMTGRYLAEYGAEVIKVESKGKIDQMRFPATLAQNLGFDDFIEAGFSFMDPNRGAKNIQANLKNPKTIELMKKLVGISDVVIENYSPGVFKSLGLGYEVFKEINPSIIMLSLSAVGQDGPMRDLMTYGATISSISGVQSMLGYPDGEPAQDYAVPDYNGAVISAFLVLAALRYLKRTGKGQYIDAGQAAPMLYLMGEPMMDVAMNGRVAGLQGNHRIGFAPHNYYRCKPDGQSAFPDTDQRVSIAVKTDEEWKNLCMVMGNPAWASEEKFADRVKRWQNQDDLDEKITGWTMNYTAYEITDNLQQAGVAAMPVMDSSTRPNDPHVKARETFRLLDTAAVKAVPMNAEAVRFSRSKAKWERGSRLGEDNNYVYGDLLGLSKEEITRLVDEKVIF